MKTIRSCAQALGFLLFLSSCGPPVPTLEALADPEAMWVERGPVEIESMSIERNGSAVRAEGVFLQGGDRIRMSLELFLEPPARFVSGSHSSQIGGQAFAGPVSSDSVEFFGGQNEGPSVGGVFVFENSADGIRYRLRLPPVSRTF